MVPYVLLILQYNVLQQVSCAPIVVGVLTIARLQASAERLAVDNRMLRKLHQRLAEV